MWIQPEEAKAIENWVKKQERYILFYYKPAHTTIAYTRMMAKRDLKFCIVMVGNTIKTCKIDNHTYKIYKLDGYQETWIIQKGAKFIKYLNSMEL